MRKIRINTMPERFPLTHLPPGQKGVIAAVEGSDGLRLRLAALGFRVGRAILMMRRGNLSGPLHVRLGTTDVAIRLAEAVHVTVRAPAAATP